MIDQKSTKMVEATKLRGFTLRILSSLALIAHFSQVLAFQQPPRYINEVSSWGYNVKKNLSPCFVHVAAHPPEHGQTPIGENQQGWSEQRYEQESLKKLCTLLQVTPTDLLYLRIASEDGERGVYVNDDVAEGESILRIPLSSCIRDDSPPIWYQADDRDDEPIEISKDNPHHFNPSQWATRLAASLLNRQMKLLDNESSSPLIEGQRLWLSMMPDPNFLRASLPIHWPEKIVSSAKCTALELSIDSSYFTRAEAVADLVAALDNDIRSTYTKEELDMKCQNAFDLVQTRSCRVEPLNGAKLCPSLRVLAPIFDFINHGSARHDGIGSANAYFGLEGEENSDDGMLVVRAKRDISKNEEILIEYGDSTRPAWRCLASYGFVPEYRITTPDEEWEGEEDESVAEVFMEGNRYEVGSHTVPFDMVETATLSLRNELSTKDCDRNDESEEVTYLSADVALRIAKRVSDAAFQLLVEPNNNELIENDPEAIISYRNAASLRWSQHKVLLACAVGLRDYATNANSPEREEHAQQTPNPNS